MKVPTHGQNFVCVWRCMRPLERVVRREDAGKDDGGQVEAGSECQALEYAVLRGDESTDAFSDRRG